MHVKLLDRLKFAYSAFMFNSDELIIRGYEQRFELSGAHNCDMDKVNGNTCNNKYKVGISRTIIKLVIDNDDSVYVCDECASEMFGSKEEKNNIVINGELNE